MDRFLAPDGAVARRLGARYEPRPEQQAMLRAVAGALEGGGKLLVEAGTGVGKSFAYLLPAIAKVAAGRAGGDRRRVVISTHTIALQEQLMEKDIPLLRAVVPDEFSAVLVKGRGNYLSLRRLAQASKRQTDLFADPAAARLMHAIEDWAYETDDGSLATLPVVPRGDVWDKVQSDSTNCMGRRCPTYQQCFYQSARRRMENADILVVNHALFFSDLALRAEGVGFLPPYDHVILDEAHMIEDVASDHFGLSCSEGRVRYLLGSLYQPRTGKGYLVSLGKKVAAELLDRAASGVLEAERAAERVFDELVGYQQTRGRRNGRIDEPGVVENPLTPRLAELAVSLNRLKDQVDAEADRYDLSSFVARCEAVGATLKALLDQTQPDSVYWLEVGASGRSRRVELACSPIDVGPLLKERLFGATNPQGEPLGVVLTSATLSTRRSVDHQAGAGEPGAAAPVSQGTASGGGGSASGGGAFGHIMQRLGCAGAATLQLGSPFDYAEQAELIVDRTMPDPGSPAFVDRLGPAVLAQVERSDGGAFVLFTSYDLLRRTAAWLRPRLAGLGMPVLVQGEEVGRSELLARFRADRRSVLLGTDSFWQGVDVQGDGLRNVVITRLPFAVPDRPLTEARMQRITEQGGSAFAQYSLPEAILKFKQGFGRLIRSRQDRGAVVVLDPRIVTRSYGRRFIEALPRLPVRQAEAVGGGAGVWRGGAGRPVVISVRASNPPPAPPCEGGG